MITILSWFWSQPGVRSAYTPEHVSTWATMVRRHLTIPHRIACVTATPEGIDPSVHIITPPGEFEDIRIPTWESWRPQCLRRISMFRPDAADIFGERFICMDLDCLIAANLDALFSEDFDFRIFKGTAPGRRYNGSLIGLRAGARPQVYEKFTAAGAIAAGQKFIGSDQAWISHIIPNERTWSDEDGVDWWNGLPRRHDNAKLMFFPGDKKPWDLIDVGSPWVEKHYRNERAGRCLVLGYNESVWDDLEVALQSGPFDHVISSPEAALHWPGPKVVANSDQHAERLARMMGYSDVVFCGRSEKVAA